MQAVKTKVASLVSAMRLLLFPSQANGGAAAGAPKARPWLATSPRILLAGASKQQRRGGEEICYARARYLFARGRVCDGVLSTTGREIPARCLAIDSVRRVAGRPARVEARLRTGKVYEFHYHGESKHAVRALQLVIMAEASRSLPQ